MCLCNVVSQFFLEIADILEEAHWRYIFSNIKWNVLADRVNDAPALAEHFAVLQRYGEPSLKEALESRQESLPYMLITYLHKEKKEKIFLDSFTKWQNKQGIVCTEPTQEGMTFLLICE